MFGKDIFSLVITTSPLKVINPIIGSPGKNLNCPGWTTYLNFLLNFALNAAKVYNLLLLA